MMVNKMVKLFNVFFRTKTLKAFLLVSIPIPENDKKGFLLDLDWQGVTLLWDF